MYWKTLIKFWVLLTFSSTSYLGFAQMVVTDHSCDCAQVPAGKVSMVFTGIVKEVGTNHVGVGLKVTVQTLSVFSGEVSPITVVSGAYPGENCGVDFVKDSVYLFKVEKKRSLKTSTCLGTKLYSQVTPQELAELGKGKTAVWNEQKSLKGIWMIIIVTIIGFIILLFIIFRKRNKRSASKPI